MFPYSPKNQKVGYLCRIDMRLHPPRPQLDCHKSQRPHQGVHKHGQQLFGLKHEKNITKFSFFHLWI